MSPVEHRCSGRARGRKKERKRKNAQLVEKGRDDDATKKKTKKMSRFASQPPRRAPWPPRLSFSLGCALLLVILTAAAPGPCKSITSTATTTSGITIETFDERGLKEILNPDNASVSVLASGHLWAEGPVFWSPQTSLLFSDVRDNAIYSWNASESESGSEKEEKKKKGNDSVSELLRPSGWLSATERPTMWEPGSNGLAFDTFNNLVAAQHGERQVALVPLSEILLRNRDENGNGNENKTVPRFCTVARTFQGKRFNSPNDLAFHPENGDLWFTDPVYGLEKYGDDPKRELGFQGVFRVEAAAYRKRAERSNSETADDDDDSGVTLEISSMSSPNGIAFSPDGRTLFVSNSGKEASFWASFDIDPETGRVVKGEEKKKKEKEKRNDDDENETNGTCSSSPSSSSSSSNPLPSLEEDGGKKLWDVTDELKAAREAGRPVGASDGFKLDNKGNVFASAIDSVFIFSPRFESLLGKIVVGDKIGNVAFGGRDGSELFIAANSRILRVKTRTKGSFVHEA